MATTNDGVEVKLGADTADAKSSMDSAATSIADSLKSISTALEGFGSKNKSTIDKAIQNNANLSRSFLELKGSATGGFNAIAGVIERFRGVIGTLAAALAGGLIGKEAVSSLVAFRDAVHSLESEFGLTSQAASLMAVNLKLAGVSVDSYGMMAQRVSMKLHTQPEEFQRLGVAIKDAQGNFLPLDEILKNTYQTMLEYKPGTDQMQFALSTVSRNAKDFKEDMENLTKTNEMAKKMFQELGLEIGDDAQEKVRAYKVELNAFQLTLEAIGVKIATAMLPSLMKLGEWLVSFGPSIVNNVAAAWAVFSNVISSVWQVATPVWEILKKIGTEIASSQPVVAAFKLILEGLVVAFRVLGTGVEIAMQGLYQLWEVFRLGVAILYDVSKGLSGFFDHLAHGDWVGAKAAVASAWHDIEQDSTDAMNRIVKSNAEGIERIKALWSGAATYIGDRSAQYKGDSYYGQGGEKKGTKSYTDKPKGTDDLAGLENELKAEENAYNNRQLQQGSFQTWSIEQTRDYWEEVLSMDSLSAKQRQDAENHYYDAERKVQEQSFSAMISAIKAQEAALKNDANAKIQIAEAVYALEVSRYGATSVQAQAAYAKILEARQHLKDEIEKLADIQAKKEAELAKLQIAGAQQMLQQRVALRQISSQQEYAEEAKLQAQLYQLELDGFAKREAAAQGDLVKLAEIDSQRAIAFQQNQNKMTAIAQAAEKDREQYALQADQAVQTAFGNLIDSLTSRTKTLKQTWLDFTKELTSSLNKIASNQIANQLFGSGSQGGSAISGIMSKIFGGAGGSGQSAAQAANTTAVSALTVAIQANTLALQSSAASGGGGLGSVFSDNGGSAFDMSALPGFAEGTNYVPQTSLALVHQGEAIVPARYNDRSGMSMTNHTHIYVNGSPDTRTLHQIDKAAAAGVRKAQIRANGS